MSKRIKGITIELDGETKGLDKALQDVNKRSRDLQGELRDVDRLLKFNPGNIELIEQKQKLLGDQIENTSEKLKRLQEAEKDVQEQFKQGKIKEDQYRAFQREIVETQSKLKHFEGQLEQSQTKVRTFGDKLKESSEKVKEVGDKVNRVGDGMKDFGGKMSAYVTAPLIGGLGLVTKGTEELRQDLARLETNAENAGIGAEKINEQLVRLSGVSDETDSNVEALSNLLATGFDETGLTSTIDALSGAVIKFPDTLKIEGLADGLQETLATGKAIGPFAELLERLGMDLDVFNEGLAEAAENGEEQNYIMKTLAETGLADVNEQYRKNNEELVKSKESQMTFQQSMAELGDTLAPIMTMITEKVSELIDWFNNLSPTGQQTVLIIASIAAGIGPLIMIIGTLVSAIGGIITIAGTLGVSLSGILVPVGIAIAAIVGLIAIFSLAYKELDWFREMVDYTWDVIKQTFVNVIDFLKALVTGDFEGMKEAASTQMELMNEFISTSLEKMKEVFYLALEWISEKLGLDFEEMKNAVDSYLNMILGIANDVWSFIENSFKNSLKFIKSLLTGDFEGMREAVSDQMENIRETIASIWGRVEKFFDEIDLFEIGKNIISGLINGVKSMASSLVRSVKGVVGDAIDGAKRLLGIASPSKVFKEIGVNTGEGFEIGIASMVEDIQRASDKMVQASIPDLPDYKKVSHVSKIITADQTSSTPNNGQNLINFEKGVFEGAIIFDDYGVDRLMERVKSRLQSKTGLMT